jgi:aminopeptidase N
LLSVSINKQLLPDSDYTVTPTALTISHAVLSRFPPSFELTTAVRLCPRENLALSGLYASSAELLCTQCEAVGFRRITYHLDR